jgi:hypothetical protein
MPTLHRITRTFDKLYRFIHAANVAIKLRALS